LPEHEKIDVACPCGATMSYEGSSGSITYEMNKWREVHEGHHELPVITSTPITVTVSSRSEPSRFCGLYIYSDEVGPGKPVCMRLKGHDGFCSESSDRL
jgi:hypothetical protein